MSASHEGAGLGLHSVEQVDGGQDERGERAELGLARDQRRPRGWGAHPPWLLQHDLVSVLVHGVVVVDHHEVASRAIGVDLVRLADKGQQPIGVNRIRIPAPGLPQVRAEGNAEVEARLYAEVCQAPDVD